MSSFKEVFNVKVFRWDVLPVEMGLNANSPSDGKCFRNSCG